MKINRVVSLLVVSMLLLSLAGCSKSEGSSKKVVFIAQMSTGDYWVNLSNSFKKEAEKKGYSYKFTGPEKWDINQQAEVIKKVVKEEKPDAIILAPIGDSELFPAIKEANDSDIPIILVDNDMNRELLSSYGAHVTTYVGINNYNGGVKVADQLLSKVSKGDKAAILYGDVSSINCEDRCDGFYDEVEKNGVDVVDTVSYKNGSDKEAYENTKLLLTAYPDIKVFFAANSSIYKGMEQAINEYNKSVIAGTFDSDDDILKSIESGKLTCTFDQNSEGVAKGTIKVIDDLVKGEKVKDVTTIEGKMITK